MNIDRRGLAGVLVMSFAFGSLHAFASLLAPLQDFLQADRGLVSLGYSLAIAGLTLGVFAGAWLAKRYDDRLMCAACGIGGAAGLAIAALWPSVPVFLLTYGLAFGLCNGIAYGLFIARAGLSWPSRNGLSVGLATATYGLGAAFFGLALGFIANAVSVEAALLYMSGAVFIGGAAAGLLFRPGRRNSTPSISSEAFPHFGGMVVVRLWLSYFLSSCGGLMIIAHSEAILAWLHVPYEIRSMSVSFNACGNILGSVLGGLLADRLRPKIAFALPVAMSIVALLLLLTASGDVILLMALVVAGMAYGGLISVVPAVLRHQVGAARFQAIFPVVFSAWGLAGVLGPALAGFLYVEQASYDLAILVAAAMATGALALILRGRFGHPPAVNLTS